MLVEAEVGSSSVSIVYVVGLLIVFLKAVLQKRGSMEPMEPHLDPPMMMVVACSTRHIIVYQGLETAAANNMICSVVFGSLSNTLKKDNVTQICKVADCATPMS